LELSHAEFMAIDLPVLRRCDELLVLAIEGWLQSPGVQQELGLALALKKPVTMIKEKDIERLPAIPRTARCYLTSPVLTEVDGV
jgi:nucleoside 2-deoxyribosyltransferase